MGDRGAASIKGYHAIKEEYIAQLHRQATDDGDSSS